MPLSWSDQQLENGSGDHVHPASPNELPVQDVGAIVRREVDSERARKRVDARLTAQGPPRKHARHLEAQRLGRQPARNDVKPLFFLPRSIGDAEPDAHIGHHARDHQAVAGCRLYVAVERDRTSHRIEHLTRKLRVDERSHENPRGNARGGSDTPRGNVVNFEEALHEATAQDEADVPSGLRILDSHGWPKNGAGCAATRVANHGFCAPMMRVDVSSNGSDRPRGSEGKWRERGARKSSHERGDTRHAGSVAAGEDYRIRSLLRYVDGRTFEVVKIARFVNARTLADRHLCEGVEKAVGWLQASRVAVEDDVDAPSHGAAG